MVTLKQIRTKAPKSLKRRIKHLLVPHAANQYRPHLIRWQGLAIVAVLALCVQIGYSTLSSGKVAVLGRTSTISSTELLDKTNAERMLEGLPSLTINAKLNDAAFMKAKDMFAYNYWAHESPTGVTPWKWLGDAEYDYDVAGENLAKNYTDASSTVAAWMASETHRANILDERYKDVGFAVVEDVLNGRETTVVVAYYGRAVEGMVSAATDQKKIENAPAIQGISNPVAYVGSALQSLSPVTLGVLALLVVIGIVALVTHHYRNKLPKSFRNSWKRHHAAYTLTIIVCVFMLIVVSTGGGQI